VEFVRDARDGQFRFLEINPRVWGSIGFGRFAGVDFHTPYRELARGKPVAADLAFRVGVVYRRVGRDLRLLRRRPARIVGFLGDFLDPRVHCDICWRDLRPYLPAGLHRGADPVPGSPGGGTISS
jgi:hypothetical protein